MREPLEELHRGAESIKQKLMGEFDRRPNDIIALVIPIIKQTVGSLCLSIKERHKVDKVDAEQIHCVHYTGVDTIISMLYASAKGEKEYLRSYDSWNFNDPDEGFYFMRQMEKPILSLSNPPASDLVQHAYVTSFILDQDNDMSDSLLFWRTYGRDGDGCSLRFPFPLDRLYRVLYGSCEAKDAGEELKQIYDTYKRQIIEALDTIISMIEAKSNTAQAELLVNEIIDLAFIQELESLKYLYKSEYYKYENEARVVTTLDSIREREGQIEFDLDKYQSKGILRHYYEDEDLAAGKIFISGCTITLGPNVDDYNLQFCLEKLQNLTGQVGPEIRSSKVSYRKT